MDRQNKRSPCFFSARQRTEDVWPLRRDAMHRRSPPKLAHLLVDECGDLRFDWHVRWRCISGIGVHAVGVNKLLEKFDFALITFMNDMRKDCILFQSSILVRIVIIHSLLSLYNFLRSCLSSECGDSMSDLLLLLPVSPLLTAP